MIKSLETVFLIAICHPTGNKRQSETPEWPTHVSHMILTIRNSHILHQQRSTQVKELILCVPQTLNS